jgi:hypothetical protein
MKNEVGTKCLFLFFAKPKLSKNIENSRISFAKEAKSPNFRQNFFSFFITAQIPTSIR